MNFKKSIRFALTIAAVAAVSGRANAQGMKVGDNPGSINPNSVLELQSTNKGFVAPRVALTATNSSAPLSATPALLAGTIVYNTATTGSGSTAVTPGYYFWDGSGWQRVLAGSQTLSANGPLSYNASTGILSISKADGTTDGYLASSDWITFNKKYQHDSLSATGPLTYNGWGVFGINKATGSADGYLSSTDWNTFNNKVTSISGTTGNIVIGGTSTNPTIDLANIGSNGTYTKVTVDAFGRVTSGTTISSSDLTDFAVSSPAAGQFLRWNGSKWVNQTAALDEISDVTLSSPATGDLLYYNGSNWVNSSLTSSVRDQFSATAPLTYDSSTGVFDINRYNVTSSDITITNGTGQVVGGSNMSLTINKGDLTTSTSGVTISGGTGVVLGNGATVNIATASGSQNGLLSSTDWNTFNNKQTASLANGKIWIGDATGFAAAQTLSGDATISNSGVLTLANSGVTAGNYGVADKVSTITVDSKGRLTVAGETSIQIAESQVTGLTSHIDGKVASVSGTNGNISSTGGTNPILDLVDAGTSGTYYKVTTDAKGRVVSGVSSISTSDLSNVNAGTASSGDVLQFDGSKWVNVPATTIQGVLAVDNVSSGTTLTLTGAHHTLLCDASSADVTLTLPNPATNKGRVFVVIKTDVGNDHMVSFSGYTPKWNSASTLPSMNMNKTVVLQSDGSNWWVINQY